MHGVPGISIVLFTFWLIPIYLLSSLAFFVFLLPAVHVTQTQGQQAGSSPPPHYGTRLRFHREKYSALSSLVDSRRVVLS